LVLGQLATQHRAAAELRTIGSWIALNCGVQIAVIPEANSAAGWLAGCIPHRGVRARAIGAPGRNAAAMSRDPLAACALFGLEPSLDYASPASLDRLLNGVEFVLSFSAFRSGVPFAADIALPLVPFTENSGTFINLEGKQQVSFPAIAPTGQARPGWKILRVLGNMLELDGFDYVKLEEVTGEIAIPDRESLYQLNDSLVKPLDSATANNTPISGTMFERILDIPIYSTDATVRRANSLQRTQDSLDSATYLHPQKLAELGLEVGTIITVRSEEGIAELPVQADDRLLTTCAYIPAGRNETAVLGSSGIVWLDLHT